MQHRVPSGDEGPWLRMASRCGTGQFLESKVIEHDLYLKKKIPHPEDNRSPLYPVFIKTAQLIVKDYFSAGQIVNCTGWIALFLVAAFSLSKRIGKSATLIALLYLSVSPLFFQFTAQVYPDLFVALAYFILLLYGPEWVRTTKGTIITALITGGLILTKSTGVFIIPVIIYYFFVYAKNKQILLKSFLFTAIVVILLLPWVLRNFREFGSPLYQFSEYNLYVDNFNYLLTVGIKRPSLAEYIHEKGIFFLIFVRPFQGIQSLLLNFPKFDEYLSLALIPFTLAGLEQLTKRKRGIIAAGLFTAPYFIFMGYTAYAVWVHRFTMIFYLFLYVAAGAGVVALYQKITTQTKNKPISILLAAVAALLPLLTLVYPLEYYLSQRGSDAAYDRENKYVIAKTEEQLNSQDVVFSSFVSDYCYMHDFAVVDKLNYGKVEQLTNLLNYYNVSFLMLDKKSDRTTISELRLDGYLNSFTIVTETENIVVYHKTPVHPQSATKGKTHGDTENATHHECF
ncbi:MAG TPA: glycosyltransferase family 39 protein [Chitinispirillaceae bacterium]|nr:glycosyltransferase family 39 protein [Chitinispirillaceae bacterium]